MRGYIIKSRIRRAENLLLANPYSPWLFGLGAPAGPNYLLRALRGEPRTELLKLWKAEEKQAAADKEAEQMNGMESKWPLSMKLECRSGTRLRRITAFTTYRRNEAIWNTCIARGAELACMNCRT